VTTNRSRLLVAGFCLAALATLGACGGGSSTKSAKSGSGAKAVEIKDFAFSPSAITVKAGTKVTWTNHDGFDHTVTAEDKSFDSQHVAKDGTFEQTFQKAGTFKYFCAIHNSMTGTVTVQ
jgi:plastocyanin